MLILQDISYIHSNKTRLFRHINLSLDKHRKMALVGNNGSGKSTLLRIIAGELKPESGQVLLSEACWYVPQHFGQYDHLTVAQTLQIDRKYKALLEILDGEMTENNLAALDEDWMLEERCQKAFTLWELQNVRLSQRMDSLSGGQKTKVFLAGISIHQPALVLLDEPGNHLDTKSRQLLSDFIRSATCALLVVSHDRQLLDLFDMIAEMNTDGIKLYGGNYTFYKNQKEAEKESLEQQIAEKEKSMRKAAKKSQETLERRQKLDSRGKGKQEKAGLPRIMMNTLRNNAEKSTAHTKEVHDEKKHTMQEELRELYDSRPHIDRINFGFRNAELHTGKVLLSVNAVNYRYDDRWLWKTSLNIEIRSGERVTVTGPNGSGKTTLLRLLLGELSPTCGNILRSVPYALYIDQEYSLIDGKLNVYEMAQQFNHAALEEHEVKTRLHRFLFTREHWDRPCTGLSGGERLRLLLCCLTFDRRPPDLIVLDEPTNNLDIRNMEILTAALNTYKGTLIVVSHDARFIQQIGLQRSVCL